VHQRREEVRRGAQLQDAQRSPARDVAIEQGQRQHGGAGMVAGVGRQLGARVDQRRAVHRVLHDVDAGEVVDQCLSA
jgi:hypothetical protein